MLTNGNEACYAYSCKIRVCVACLTDPASPKVGFVVAWNSCRDVSDRVARSCFLLDPDNAIIGLEPVAIEEPGDHRCASMTGQHEKTLSYRDLPDLDGPRHGECHEIFSPRRPRDPRDRGIGMGMTIREQSFSRCKSPREYLAGHTSSEQNASIRRPIHHRDGRLKSVQEAFHRLIAHTR